ncbi:MAG: nucleoside triphosphate pyrophosphohydrolase [Eubacterium sp.]|nr:nucleoside triphosphate pyrophosphohydrolase [Eubacterium sp.]
MAVKFEFKDRYDFNDLLSIITLLRAPGGCPWDREQTHFSIKKNFIEETYEVVEAINKESAEMLREELGDVLLQIALHCEMESEKGSFDFNDVVDELVKKLVIRHPHVFGNVVAENEEQALDSWNTAKAESKKQKSQTESMLSVPRELPALMRAQKIQHKAAKAGFDWDELGGAADKLYEELNELKLAISKGDSAEIEEEFGDVLFSCVNISRFLKLDSEEALTRSTDKFLSRFEIVEQLALEKGIELKEASIEVLDTLWEEAKIIKDEQSSK